MYDIGQPLDGLYFIINGQAKLVVNLLMHITQYPHLRLEEEPNERFLSRMQELQKAATISELIQEVDPNKEEKGIILHQIQEQKEKELLWEKPLRRQGYSQVEKRLSKQNFELALVSSGEIIGMEFTIMTISKH